MALVKPEIFIVLPRHGVLNRHAAIMHRANGDILEINGPGLSFVRASKGKAEEFHALVVSRKRQCLVLMVDQTLRFINTQSWNVENELYITNKNLMIRDILQYLRDSTIILDGYFYDEESGKVRQMNRPTHGLGGLDVLGMLVLSRGRVATVDLIGKVKIWNMRTQECVGSFATKQRSDEADHSVNDIVELSDGNLATAGSDGSIKIWRETRNPYRDIFKIIRAREKKTRAKNMLNILCCGSVQED